MDYRTDYKRVMGLGSAKDGTEHFWQVKLSSIALAILIPLFIFTFGRTLGSDYETALAVYSQPFPAIVAALTLVVGWMHFKQGVQVLIEDYTGGATRTALIVATTCLSYAAAAAGIFAVARIAL
ncbi:succinate dehydrogenase, hydrophobic membrane anchor protein [Pontivivens ytuae]|uniref:Succinate dehydrogenase hydrophobic membrane anchor subunit n=1 Tax=Pontivivens ytuae TaxID=2789856 RepID=A0A7S9QBL5_9RHOB|nr:succinate dehydrogenase, hydrophobic membrane anchor protein [Pontivivens ytuae]QPH52865.1 succinate dehydrogenase, hydrophobic membrane anchor protein [Pontivivens ytuae]